MKVVEPLATWSSWPGPGRGRGRHRLRRCAGGDHHARRARLTLRPNTERPVTSPMDQTARHPGTAAHRDRGVPPAGRAQTWPTPPLWDGHAGERIAAVVAGGSTAALRRSHGRLGGANGASSGASGPAGSRSRRRRVEPQHGRVLLRTSALPGSPARQPASVDRRLLVGPDEVVEHDDGVTGQPLTQHGGRGPGLRARCRRGAVDEHQPVLSRSAQASMAYHFARLVTDPISSSGARRTSARSLRRRAASAAAGAPRVVLVVLEATIRPSMPNCLIASAHHSVETRCRTPPSVGADWCGADRRAAAARPASDPAAHRWNPPRGRHE